jgi:hypothetical protein
MERLRFWKPVHVAPEHIDKGAGGVISVALQGHRAIGVMQEGKHVQGSIADVLEFLEALFHVFGLQIGRKALEDLDARTLIKEEQTAGWVLVKANEVFHFGEKTGVGDVKEVAGLMRLEPVALQNAM